MSSIRRLSSMLEASRVYGRPEGFKVRRGKAQRYPVITNIDKQDDIVSESRRRISRRPVRRRVGTSESRLRANRSRRQAGTSESRLRASRLRRGRLSRRVR